ncbi:bromodomain adjacent to zinc finger domain protein 1A [Gastrophryne carolinensis]
MPLLHRKPFTRAAVPADLLPTERLFHCRVTNEVFRDYDDFFERTILCNSLVWSCSFTGKSGLTYQEALESERKIKKSMQNFPEPIAVPVLYLAMLASHQRMSDLCNDIYDYVKDRFFVGETVTVVRNSGARLECTVLEVKAPPQQNGITDVNSDTIIISDSDDDEPSKAVQESWKKREPVDPTLFKYKVKPLVEAMYESVTVRHCQVSRKPALLSKERLKYFLKLQCETQIGIIKPKSATLSKYQILERNYFHYFPDEPPRFEPSSDRKPVHKDNGLTPRQSQIAAQKERDRIMQHKRELRAKELEKMQKRKASIEEIKSSAHKGLDEIQQKEEIKRLVEERRKKQEERQIIKLEREKERVKIREEKRKFAERLKLWSKRRDDMECDDLQTLPDPTPVKTRLPPECFGDALMVLEFLHAFGHLFDIKDEFPEGISFELLEEALVNSDSEGPLCELMFFFLSAIFHAMAEEEEEVANDQITEAETKGLTEALGEDPDSANSVLSAVASLAAAWPQLNHGCSLKELDLDSCTLSEILRLLMLSSGADSNSVNAKYRYQKQGGFVATDDACMEFRLSQPIILKKLSTTSVYALSPGEKLRILHALCGRLLALVSTRVYIEDCVEELRQAKQEFRELKAGQSRKEREDAAARIRKRKEDKLKEQDLKVKEILHELREDENKDLLTKGPGNGVQEKMETSNGKEAEQLKTHEHGEAVLSHKKGIRGQNKDSLGNKETVFAEELQQKMYAREQELVEKIQQVTSCTNILPLGRDRWYRRYWTFCSVPGLFVEEDYTGITEDMLQPHSARLLEPDTIPADCRQREELETPKPIVKPNLWCYYNSVEQLELLIERLNTRGHRESFLRDTLIQEKSRICLKLGNCPVDRFHTSDSPPSEESPDATPKFAERQLELRLCELLLDIEDRIYQGSLGSVKVTDRQAWRATLEKSSYGILEDEIKGIAASKQEENYVDDKQSPKDLLQDFKSEMASSVSTTTSTPQPAANCIRFLAQALLQIEQGVERKYLKAPLGEAECIRKDSKIDKRKKDDRKKKENDQTNEGDDIESGRFQRTLLDRWRESLLSSSSLSQIFLYLATLERSIMWSRSILNFRCKVCRKKGDSECMLLCDGCERGHHIYCVRPKLKCVPDGEWFCPECRPKKRRKPGRKRLSIDSDQANESLSEEQFEELIENEGEVASLSEDESTNKKKKSKLRLPCVIKRGKASSKPGPKKVSGRTAKSQQGTPINTVGSVKGRGRGKKSYSAPPQENKFMRSLAVNEDHNTSLVELISGPEQSRGRGRGKVKKMASVHNTPIGSPFAFRPFSLDNSDGTPKGRKRQSLTSTPVYVKGKRSQHLSEISSSQQGCRRSSGRHHGVHELSACEQLVVELVRHDDSWPFMRLVSKAQVPDYYEVIQRPIALNIIREKVNKCEYKSASEFIDDVQLMFFNCFEYNQLNSNEANAGLRLQAFFISEAQKLGLDVSASKPCTPATPAKKSRI